MTQNASNRRSQMRFTGTSSDPRILTSGLVGKDSARDEKGRSLLPKLPHRGDLAAGTLELKYGVEFFKALKRSVAS